MYPDLTLILGGEARATASEGTMTVSNPANGQDLATIPRAGRAEAEEAARLSLSGFAEWSALSPYERSKVMRRAADLMRERADRAARIMTLEQGKPLAEARGEWMGSADLL
ncbi:aldehyde dehydrogenase family protein, partial [Rhodovulum sulfidophilum]